MKEEAQLALRDRLASLRAQKGLTLDQLALEAGVSRRTVAGIAAGHVVGSLETWLRIGQALEVSYDELLGGILTD
ncbi:helix-turn-helix transcriptional regulator [Leucobacter salsicius]|uniref:helix-turn-helix transcriptional regulator n=1 Tax=Leucobacter salsicius TaxID=664638 RepID=UPI00037FD947